MMRIDPATGNIVSVEQTSFISKQESVYDSTDQDVMYKRMVAKILESFSAYLKKGSGWMLKGVVRLDITHAKNKPLKGSSHIPLPNGLGGKKTLINMQNYDKFCFKWAITRALNPVDKNPQRITKILRKQVEELNWEGIEFPTPCEEKMYKKFEENNDVSLLVSGHVGSGEDLRIIPLYVPKVRRERVVCLFFLKKGENSHYCIVRSMSRLISAQVRSDHEEIHVCDYCLNYFCSQDKLGKHTESCSKHDAVNTTFPKPGKNILKFKNIQNCVRCPIYADTESFLSPINERRGETELYQRHVMSTFCFLRERIFYRSRYVRDGKRRRRGGQDLHGKTRRSDEENLRDL